MSRQDRLEEIARISVDCGYRLHRDVVHGKQVLNYLRLMELPLGHLMHFGQATFKDGLQRAANNYFRQSS